MVCAKRNVDPNSLSLTFCRRSRRSVLVNLIRSLMERNDIVPNLVSQDIRYLIDNGSNADFWLDNWTGKGDLKSNFPIIFALATVKQGIVSLFGQWNEGYWSWNVQLCREPLDWEKTVWDDFLHTLEETILDEYAYDMFIWTSFIAEKYYCKSFRCLL